MQGKLGEEKKSRLTSLGFRWTRLQQQRHKGWGDFYNDLNVFLATHGHTHVPRSMSSLAAWTNVQRKHHREGKLGIKRTSLLTKLGFDLDALTQPISRDDRWNEQ
jgi:hypothetical protein